MFLALIPFHFPAFSVYPIFLWLPYGKPALFTELLSGTYAICNSGVLGFLAVFCQFVNKSIGQI